MKKLYTSALAVVVLAGSVSAQHPVREQRTQAEPDRSHVQRPDLSAAGTNRAVIWTNDFSNPADWVISHDGNQALDWQIGTGLTSQGDFPTPAIESTTASNGYAMLDSDGFGNNTTNYEQAQLTTGPIDLSAYPNVILEFQSQYRAYNDEQTFVVISTNNTDWPVLDDPLMDISAMPNVFYAYDPAELTQGVSPGNPYIKRLNISAVAGGQNQVWVRFQFTGIYGYTWYLDDVNISEQFQYDAVLNYGVLSHTGLGEEYGRVPSTQIGSTMNVGAQFSNFGVDPQTNVVVTCNVVDANSLPAFNASATAAVLNAGESLSMDEVVTLPTLATGLYTATFNVTSDQAAGDGFPENNTVIRTFEITDDVFSLDNIGNYPAGTESLAATGTNSFTGGEDGLMLFTYYPIETAQTVYGLEFLLANGTVEGGTVTAAVHDTTDVLADIVDAPLGTSAEYTITADDLANGKVTLSFSSPIALPVGDFFAGIELYSNSNTNDTRVLDDVTVPQPAFASAIFIPGDQTYSNGNAYAIRLLFNNDVNVAEVNSLVGINMYPNPSNGLVTINASTTDKYTVEVMNVLGEVVHTDNFNMNLNMDLNGLAKGVYTVRVSTPTAAAVQRVTLN